MEYCGNWIFNLTKNLINLLSKIPVLRKCTMYCVQILSCRERYMPSPLLRTNVRIFFFLLRGYIGSANDDKSDVESCRKFATTIKIKIYRQRVSSFCNFPLRLDSCARVFTFTTCIALKIRNDENKNCGKARALFQSCEGSTAKEIFLLWFLISFFFLFFLLIQLCAGKLRTHGVITVTITRSHGKANMNMYQVHLLPSPPVRYGKGAETIQYQVGLLLRNVPGNGPSGRAGLISRLSEIAENFIKIHVSRSWRSVSCAYIYRALYLAREKPQAARRSATVKRGSSPRKRSRNSSSPWISHLTHI